MDTPNRGDQGHSTLNEICREGRQPIVTKVCPPELDRHILALNVAGFFQPLAERRGDVGGLMRRPGAEISDRRDGALLCADRHWVCGNCPSEECDEFSPFHYFYDIGPTVKTASPIRRISTSLGMAGGSLADDG
jgi:hypothetical protein